MRMFINACSAKLTLTPTEMVPPGLKPSAPEGAKRTQPGVSTPGTGPIRIAP
jgi:hypothetical protein